MALSLMLGTAGIAQENPAPRLVARIPLPGVSGRIDHLTVDTQRNRLFVAALENGTVEIIDIAQNKYLKRIEGVKDPQGLAFDEDHDILFVAEGGGHLDYVDGTWLTMRSRVANVPDADNVRLDKQRKAVWVAWGDGELEAFDLKSGSKVAEIKFGAHPESFRLDDKTNSIYVNLPDKGEIAVVDRKTLKIKARWHPPAGANYPMFLHGNKVIIACRKPPCVIVYDAATGKLLQNLSTMKDCDDLFFDEENKKLYASCGEGFVDVFAEQRDGSLKEERIVPSEPGARTSLFVPSLHRLYIAAPKRGPRSSAILVFDTKL